MSLALPAAGGRENGVGWFGGTPFDGVRRGYVAPTDPTRKEWARWRS